MKPKLQVYHQFAWSLYPQEGLMLRDQHSFKDEENIQILENTILLATRSASFIEWDDTVDKRKYSYLKQWIQGKLAEKDVDLQYDWIMATEREVMTDIILPEKEKELFYLIETANSCDFNFLKIYELALYYKHYVQIRMKEEQHNAVQTFLDRYEKDYHKAKEALQEMGKLTAQITAYYSGESMPQEWIEPSLSSFFKNQAMSGMIRYYALVRLTFLHYTTDTLQAVLPYYEQLEKELNSGNFYSRRILSNYYSNLLIIYSKLNRLQEAEHCGLYSILHKNSDFLHYLNNLAAVQLRMNKPKAALETLQSGTKEVRISDSFHNKQGFTALFIRALTETHQLKAAERYAEGFVELHRKELLKARWHLFFTSYFQVLWKQENYHRILHWSKMLRLPELENKLISTKRYTPTLAIYHLLSLYQEGKVNSEDLGIQLTKIDAALKSHPDYNVLLERLAKQTNFNLDTLIEKSGSEYIFI